MLQVVDRVIQPLPRPFAAADGPFNTSPNPDAGEAGKLKADFSNLTLSPGDGHP